MVLVLVLINENNPVKCRGYFLLQNQSDLKGSK